jgi:hypothetical protein
MPTANILKEKARQSIAAAIIVLLSTCATGKAQNQSKMESMLDQVDQSFPQQPTNARANNRPQLQGGSRYNGNGMMQSGNGMMQQGNGMMQSGNGTMQSGNMPPRSGVVQTAGPLAGLRSIFGTGAQAAPKPPPKQQNIFQMFFGDGSSGPSDPSKLGNARENLQTARDQAQRAESDASRASSGSDKDARRSAAEEARYAASAAREAADRATSAAEGGNSAANDAASQARDAADRAQAAADRATANAESGGGW